MTLAKKENNVTKKQTDKKQKGLDVQRGPIVFLVMTPVAKFQRRFIAGACMISTLALLLVLGEVPLILALFVVEAMAFLELRRLPILDMSDPIMLVQQRYLDWSLFAIGGFWIFEQTMALIAPHSPFKWAHRVVLESSLQQLLTVGAYTLWFSVFVWLLDLKALQNQLLHFCWVHIALLFTVVQSYFIAHNIHHGLIWFFLPCSLVVCNDIAAYVCGRLFGRRRLCALSPNKTVEGFLGAVVLTVIFGYWFSGWLAQFAYLTVPHPPPLLNFLWSYRPSPDDNMQNAMQRHGLYLALYASLAAPFGGFFASALKRASNIKDFGNLIPGHGGMTDRVDCQLFMGIFTFVYYQYTIGHT